MKYLFDYGISQEDAVTELNGLNLQSGDSLLCICSGGEIPLSLLALKDIKVKAIDISPHQLRLSQLKMLAVLNLEPNEAAKFLGFTKCSSENRRKYFTKISNYMSKDELQYWREKIHLIEKGIVAAGRFEKHIRRFNKIGLKIVGKNNLLHLCEIDSRGEREKFFDNKIKSVFLKAIFQIAFHPSIYKNNGIDPKGLTHQSKTDMATRFYNKFRHFCTYNYPAENYFLQYTFLNELVYTEAFPAYLTEEGALALRKRNTNISYYCGTYNQALQTDSREVFNKFHISNVGDWMEELEFDKLLKGIVAKAQNPSKIIQRFLHKRYDVPKELENHLKVDNNLGEKLSKNDRYPFYGIVPMEYKGRI